MWNWRANVKIQFQGRWEKKSYQKNEKKPHEVTTCQENHLFLFLENLHHNPITQMKLLDPTPHQFHTTIISHQNYKHRRSVLNQNQNLYKRKYSNWKKKKLIKGSTSSTSNKHVHSKQNYYELLQMHLSFGLYSIHVSYLVCNTYYVSLCLCCWNYSYFCVNFFSIDTCSYF